MSIFSLLDFSCPWKILTVYPAKLEAVTVVLASHISLLALVPQRPDPCSLQLASLLVCSSSSWWLTYSLMFWAPSPASSIFLALSSYGDMIVVTSLVNECRDKTLITSHEIHNKGRLVVNDTEVRIWAKSHPEDPNRLRGQSNPDSQRSRFEG